MPNPQWDGTVLSTEWRSAQEPGGQVDGGTEASCPYQLVETIDVLADIICCQYVSFSCFAFATVVQNHVADGILNLFPTLNDRRSQHSALHIPIRQSSLYHFAWNPQVTYPHLRQNCRIILGENSWNCCGFGLFSCWQFWFHEKNCQKKFGWKSRENVGVLSKLNLWTKSWLFE